jgi:8-oxo-dGTP pyrophosphatase MutT (NUDIX family)
VFSDRGGGLIFFCENKRSSEEMMDLQHTTFAQDAIDAHCSGAGVLPYSVDDDGNTVVLLGRECFLPEWKGSCRWSGFEGSRMRGETVVETAAREATEETLGVLERDLGELLRRHGYEHRIVLRITSDRHQERYHCMYVIRVPWDPSLPSRFRQVRSNVEYVDRLVQEWRLTRPPALGGDNTTVGSIDGTEECVVVRQPDLTTSVFEGDDASDIWKWRRLRERLCRAVDDAHPCIRTVFEAGALRDVSVNLDHLEKDQIRWWSTVSLTEVLRCRGSFDAERFRPYFLPVLQTFLQLVGATDGVVTRSPL